MTDTIPDRSMVILAADECLSPVSFIRAGGSEVALMTDRGETSRVEKESNQDRAATGVLVTSEGVKIDVDVVCDGIGGVDGGDRAAQLFCEAVKTIIEEGVFSARNTDFPKNFIHAVLTSALESYRRGELPVDAGTTFVMTLTLPDQVYVFHLGDSRGIVMTPDGEVLWETQDQVFPEPAYSHGRVGAVRSLSQIEDLRTLLNVHTISRLEHPELIILLATDGITENCQQSEDDSDGCIREVKKLVSDLLTRDDLSSVSLCVALMAQVRAHISSASVAALAEQFTYFNPDNTTVVVRVLRSLPS
ncbi:MAG: protein phosphatase 2C domain-containing protein [bacterium]|nr:protein phosphatase 2C domain-containing protein [bacterium]